MEKGKKTCRADLEKEVGKIVDNVEGYTKKDKEKKRTEVKAAFAKGETKAKQ